MATNTNVLLAVEDLKTYFYTGAGVVKAVDGVSFAVRKGETLGLIGESGCGKTVTAFSLLRLIPDPPGKIVGGKIVLDGQDLLSLSQADMRKVRGRRIAMIFQEPMTALNPVFTIGDQVAEGLRVHQRLPRREAWERAVEMLRRVRIPDPGRRAGEYPHQLSGGMRQRAMIAMALACHPELLIADEPTTALDATIQAQILELLNQLKEELGMAVILITHDLGVVAGAAARVAVMYAGRIMEEAPVLELFRNPLHPYTRGLLASLPRGGKRGRLQAIPGSVPDLLDLPPGCVFRPRCPKAFEPCGGEEPLLKQVEDEHWVRCYLY